MKVIIPLAGLGTRLRPHTLTKPKPLVNVAGQPVLAHIIDTLTNLGPDLEEIIFITGYLGDQIEDYVKKYYSFPSVFVEQKELKGQAHAISLTRDYVKGSPVLIIFGDSIIHTDYRVLRNLREDGVIYVKPVDDPRRFGVVLVEDGIITKLVEKPVTPVSNLAIVGAYYIKNSEMLFQCIDQAIARNIKLKGEYFLADALQLMIDQGAKFKPISVDVWEDCGTPQALLQNNRDLLSHGKQQHSEGVLSNSVVIDPVYIAPTATVEHSIIGPYVTLSDGSVVRNSVIKDSIINDRSQVEDISLTDSIIGTDARVAGAFRRVNLGDSSEIAFGDNP